MAKGSRRFKLDDRKWRQIKKELLGMEKLFTLVGIQEGVNDPEGTSLALIAASNEFGTQDGHIPERPWMRGWFDANKTRIEKVAANLVKKVIDRKITGQKAIKLLGEWATGQMKKSITALRTPPNAASTIRKKGSSNPLIDTGYMRSSVTHKEVKNMSLQQLRAGGSL